MSQRFLFLLALLTIGFAGSLRAHEMSMAEMEIRELRHGEFLWQWTATERRSGRSDLVPVWPDRCQAQDALLLCGADGLRGKLSVEGVGKRYSAAIIKIFWLDGQSRVFTLTAGQPAIQLYGGANDDRGLVEVATAYGVLGVEHILSGFDHLLFVVALLFLVGFNRRLVWTITAFTVAHSITLALSALGLLTLRPPPVEAVIALSIVLVAKEALERRRTIAREWPALVAFLFGLVHGLGFAGALKEIGLPDNHLMVALLTFNFGVELGQLAVVAIAYIVYRSAARWPQTSAWRTPAIYCIGGIAAYWSIERMAGILLW